MKTVFYHQWTNRIHTAALLASMAGILGVLGWFTAGPGGLKLSLMAALAYFFFSPSLPGWVAMKAARAKPLQRFQAPELFRITQVLSRRAGLEKAPDLYYLPGRTLNAFAAGTRKAPAVCLSQGLIQTLDTRELAGILGHEITHIQHNDTKVMALAGVFGRITGLISMAGQILILLFLPALLIHSATPPLFPLLLMIFAPGVSLLLHLALSRTREFAADQGSAALTGNPRYLASALNRLEMHRRHSWSSRLFPGRVAVPSPLMSTHPPTTDRIQRLLSLPVPQPPRRPRQLARLA